MELLKDRNIFVKRRKSPKIKVILILIYHVNLSCRKIRKIIVEPESFSQEVIIEWHKRCSCLFQIEKTTLHLVSVDETKIKKEE